MTPQDMDVPFNQNCMLQYVSQHEQCPCHPAESALAIAVLKEVTNQAIVKCLTKLARQIVDDNLILSEEIIA